MSDDRVIPDFVQTGAAMKALGFVRSQPILGAVMAMLIITMVLAAFVPVLAPIPEANAGWTAPPLPDHDEPLGDFQHLLEPLPLVVRDLPDAESQNMVNLYDEATYLNLPQAQALMNAAVFAIAVPIEVQGPWDLWLADSESRPVPTVVMESLAKDPLNGDRLSNLATAMFFFNIANDPNSFAGVSYYSLKSSQLMSGTVQYFPNSRAASLNSFYFRSFLESWSVLQLDLVPWIDANPDDAVALRLGVENSISNKELSEGSVRITLENQAIHFTESNDPARVAFGYAMLGDLSLGNLGLGDFMGNSRGENAPFAMMNSARTALGFYDLSLQYSDDPSLYLARALTLSLLADYDAAIETLEQAKKKYPNQAVLYSELSELYLAKRGSPDQIHEALLVARGLERDALARYQNQSDPLVIHTRVYANNDSSTSQVANLPLAFASWKGHQGGGGGYTVAFDEIPAFSHVPRGLLAQSAALGDPQGVLDDADRFALDSADFHMEVAQLVSDPSSASREDLQNHGRIEDASGWLRFLGKPEQAHRLCKAALLETTDEWAARQINNCVAETAYLSGDYGAAENSFHTLHVNNMAGFVAEARGSFGDARVHYTNELEANFSTSYMARLRLGGILIETGDYDQAVQYFDEWLAWSVTDLCDLDKCISCVMNDCLETTHLIPHALSNRGIARMQSIANRSGNISCARNALDACISAAQDFDAALEYDAYNPVFLMNRAWVARLMGDHELSTQLMSRALESDATLYPVLTDMGVYAFDSGDSNSAREFFKDAVAANPDYDLGWWNLGVLEMQNGPRGIIRGQAYLARAIVRNPSLVTSSLNFKTDESIYRVEIDNANQPGAGWSFGRSSSLATTALGFLGAALIVFRASTHVFKDKLVELASSKVDSVRPYWDDNVAPRLTQFQSWRGIAWALLLATVFVMVLAEILPVWRGDPTTASASMTIALFALILAVITHECGHRVSAKLMGAHIDPVQWAPGIGLSLFLLPFNLSSGPFPAQRITSDDETNTLWVYLFGPLANLSVAIAVYIVYLNQPLPILRVIAITQLAVMSYSLLPFDPLDGAALARAQPKLVGGLASVAFLAGVFFSVGIL